MKGKKHNQKVEVVPAPDARKNVVSVRIIPAPPARKNVVSVGIIPAPEFAAAANLERANSDVERKVIECFGALEKAELNFRAGQEFGRAVVQMRDEMKKNGNRSFMKRLEELDVSYAKARYWAAIVEGKPINRGKAKKDVLPKDVSTPGRAENPTMEWREDWDVATAQFRKAADIISMLAQTEREGRETFIREFIGELENLAEVLLTRRPRPGRT